MASGVEELLDMLFDMVDEAKNVPLSSDKCMIERDRALDLIDDIRAQFPVELTEAKKVMATRADMLSSAKREAEAIRKAAEDKARQMVSEDVITLQAKQRANEMMQQAEERSRELMEQLAASRENEKSVDAWLDMMQDYAQFEELDRPTLVRLIQKIEISERYTVDDHKERDIHIYYNFVGYIEE